MTRPVWVGGVQIGGGAPITVQSMARTDTCDEAATGEQIERLREAGCDIVRVAVNSMRAAAALGRIKARAAIPIVADVHFDHRLALAALEGGADKLRVNPGNIGGENEVREVFAKAAAMGVPVRVGVNAGSMPGGPTKGRPSPEGMVGAAETMLETVRATGFEDIVVAIKSSDVGDTIEANAIASGRVPYPLHIGLTESGYGLPGTVKSAVCIGSVLARGIGDTIRVSLTGDPVEEVRAGIEILKSLGLYRKGHAEIVSCPTCGRCAHDLRSLAESVDGALARIAMGGAAIKVAVMGCEVNGPGEAGDADVALVFGTGFIDLYEGGAKVKRLPFRGADDMGPAVEACAEGAARAAKAKGR